MKKRNKLTRDDLAFIIGIISLIIIFRIVSLYPSLIGR